MRTLLRLLGGSVLAATTAACGGGYDPMDPGDGGNCAASYCMTSSTFTPTSRTVGVNAIVRWVNSSTTAHNVTFDTPAAALGVGNGASGNFDAPALSSNQRQFGTAGTYQFHCTIHGTPTSGMRGTVEVQ